MSIKICLACSSVGHTQYSDACPYYNDFLSILKDRLRTKIDDKHVKERNLSDIKRIHDKFKDRPKRTTVQDRKNKTIINQGLKIENLSEEDIRTIVESSIKTCTCGNKHIHPSCERCEI